MLDVIDGDGACRSKGKRGAKREDRNDRDKISPSRLVRHCQSLLRCPRGSNYYLQKKAARKIGHKSGRCRACLPCVFAYLGLSLAPAPGFEDAPPLTSNNRQRTP